MTDILPILTRNPHVVIACVAIVSFLALGIRATTRRF